VPPLVGMDGKTRLIGGANVLAISSSSKHKQAAATFVRFLLDDTDSVNYFYETSQQITTSNLEIIQNGPMSKDLFLHQYIKSWDKVNLLPIHSARIDAILDDVGLSLQKVIHGTDPTTEMKSLTQAIRDVDR
jgi:maltose-binding protein MalE